MNAKQEKEIIRTLVKAGRESLAKTFARSRGYRVREVRGARAWSLYGEGKGRYFGRRAKDSRIMPLKPDVAEEVANRPAAKTSADAPTDWLAVWWVPKEYGKESLDRVKSGWIKLLWDWGKGRLVKKGDDVVKEVHEVA